MYPKVTLVGALATGAIAIAAPASAEAPGAAAFRRDFGSFIDRLRATPNAPPGFIVIAVHKGTTVFERAYGTRDVRTNAPMTLDTPLYNASLTKAYTGVLASLLHHNGTLPLTTNLTDIWPTLQLPNPLKAENVTAAKLLSHSSQIFDGGLQHQSNATGTYRLAEVPAHLARYATPAASFRYSNFGPFLYSAVAEVRTGETWHRALKRLVLKPLGLNATTTRLEDLRPDEVGQCHVVRGGAWRRVPPKQTAVLNAAGGMYATARDTAKFLKVFTTDGAAARGKISPHVLRYTWQPQAKQDVDFGGFKRDSYGLGWDLGAYEGRRYVSRAGGYYGCRSYALWLPEEKFGIAVLSGGDAGANRLHLQLLMQALDMWIRHPEAASRAGPRIAAYHKAAAAEVAGHQTLDSRLTNPAPLDARVAERATGVYINDRLGRIVVSRINRGLTLKSGVFEGDLVPLAEGGFLFHDLASLETSAFKFIGGPAGKYEAFELDDDRYDRIAR